MKKIILTLFIAIAMLSTAQASGTMVFAKKAITKSNQDKVKKKNHFSKRDSIYARAYLSEKIGPFSKELNTNKINNIYSEAIYQRMADQKTGYWFEFDNEQNRRKIINFPR